MQLDSIYSVEQDSYEIALLIKECDLHKDKLDEYYFNTLKKAGLSQDKIISFTLSYNSENKCPASLIKEHLVNLLQSIDQLQVKILYVCDGSYFKTLTKSKKTAPHLGYVLPCAITGYEYLKVILGVNYQAMLYNPTIGEKLELSLRTLVNQSHGIHIPIGSSIIHNANYPKDVEDITKALDNLYQYKSIICDIETFGLDFSTCGIGTISFAWSEHEGVAFSVDYSSIKMFDMDGKQVETVDAPYGKQQHNPIIKDLLRNFFDEYKGLITYHNANFDIKVLIYNLYMEDDLLNQQGLLEGLEVLTKEFDDTKIIAYLATNATIGNTLSLKDLAHEFAGNYAQADIKDITLIKERDLLRYNLIDCLATYYVYNKYMPRMVKDNQHPIYTTIMLPSVKVILQMELTGMPLDMAEVTKAYIRLTEIKDTHLVSLRNSQIVKDYTLQLQKEEWVIKNLLLKVKVRPIEDFAYIKFNPASNKHLQGLFYTFLNYDIIDTTDTGLPATGAKTLKKLLVIANTKALSEGKQHIDLLNDLIGLAEVSVILNTFIAAFISKSIKKSDGRSYLHGNFNIGGTVSGRLSSSKPNLQNIPSTGSIYAGYIKKCFKAPKGWLFVGADFSSLEDRISALTTKDPNKLKVYEDGYDGHCLRAYNYYGDRMPDIIDTVSSINTIKHKYPELRQDSKEPTFLLTYGGTAYGLINTVGLSEKEAERIEDNYHKLYEVSDDWVKSKIQQAGIDGYVTLAFGLRLRTPTLARTLAGKKSTPYLAKGEARTAGNALGQSYGLLNNRAGIEFQERTLASKYALDIKPIAQIHDSMYFIIKDSYGCLKWFNDNLIECMEWQQLPELQHPIVKLGGNTELYYPNWGESYVLPNNASKNEIWDVVQQTRKV